jgi:hypothetical protein
MLDFLIYGQCVVYEVLLKVPNLHLTGLTHSHSFAPIVFNATVAKKLPNR